MGASTALRALGEQNRYARLDQYGVRPCLVIVVSRFMVLAAIREC